VRGAEAAALAPGWSVIARRYETVVRVVLGRVTAPFDLSVELDRSTEPPARSPNGF
jgi:hypothetical protein